MSGLIVDLSKIPQQGAFKTYRNWLYWKLGQLDLGQHFKLPIFSSWSVERWDTGLVLANTQDGKVFSYIVTARQTFDMAREKLIETIETGQYIHKRGKQQRLCNLAKVRHLLNEGLSIAQIAEILGFQKTKIEYYTQYLIA